MSKKINTEWNLSQLYKSPDDSQIEKDLVRAEKAHAAFAYKYKKSNLYLKNESALKKALQEYERLADTTNFSGGFYLGLLQTKDSSNQKVIAKANLISQRMQRIGNLVMFFEINISKIPTHIQKKFLVSKDLFRFRYLLKKSFETGKYVLTEPEEKILSLKSLPSHSLWVDFVGKLVSKQTVTHKGKEISVSEANYLIPNLPTQKERKELHNQIVEKYWAIADSAESEINAIVIDKKINDELRGFTESYDATIQGYDNDKKSVLNLVRTVTENFHVSQRFYNLKAKMLKLKRLSYADRGAQVGKTNQKITFGKSYEDLCRIFTSVEPEFGSILKRFVVNKQIDAYPKVGKRGGAFCASHHKAPTFILLNHVDTLDSLMTFGHEMGHAIHSEFSKSQPVFYQDYSMSTAEVASTLFESFVFYDQLEKLTEKEKIVALHDKIQDDIATIFRQIACFNFEAEMHKTIREKGNMSKEELASCMNRHMKSYLGNVELTDKDGYFFVSWMHLRTFFYVYSYAFGQLASKAIYKKYQENPAYIKEIKKFMSLGCSMSPEDIFKSIGVDVKKPDFWKKGLESIEEDITLLESLVNKPKKK
ncbi:MAG TPA: M3 family oligoendopeptidase [Candidatus Paceibacterota bacterium]